MCISVFAVIKRGEEVLVGVPKPHKRWTSEWISGWLMYSDKELDKIYRQTRLPSSYVYEGEDPAQTLRRVMWDELGIKTFSASRPRIISYNSPSDWYPGNFHWDLVIVYDVRTSASLGKLPWWRELAFLGRSELGKRDLGWNQDMMKDLGLV